MPHCTLLNGSKIQTVNEKIGESYVASIGYRRAEPPASQSLYIKTSPQKKSSKRSPNPPRSNCQRLSPEMDQLQAISSGSPPVLPPNFLSSVTGPSRSGGSASRCCFGLSGWLPHWFVGSAVDGEILPRADISNLSRCVR